MKNSALLLVASIFHLMCSCKENKLQLPVKTSYGDLVDVLKTDSLKTSSDTMVSGKDTILYILSFKGGDSIRKLAYKYYNSNDYELNHWKNYTLLGFNNIILSDSKQRTFHPSNVGFLNDKGVLCKSWQIKDRSLIETDINTLNNVITDTIEVHITGSFYSLVYSIPKKARGLYLPDSTAKYPIY
jgi:hypothetical protein